MIKKTILILCSSLLLTNGGLIPFAHADNPPVLITEVQTGFIASDGTEYPKQEFIELSNVSASFANVSNWRVEYLSSANDGSGAPTSVLSTLSGYIMLNGKALLSHSGYNPAVPDFVIGENDLSSSGLLAKSGGHVRLMNGATMVDCVSWGSAVVIAGCDKVSSSAPAGYTLQRRSNDGFYDKSAGVVNLSPPTPQGGGVVTDPPTPPSNNPVNQPGHDVDDPSTPPHCDNIMLSEILPNPAGDDTQGEFIEIYNPNTQIEPLYGCSLKLSNGHQYSLAVSATIAPQQYLAFPYTTTGLQLSNSGATVSLLTSTQEVDVSYPALGDNQAWATMGAEWYMTSLPTPNLPNNPPLITGVDGALATTDSSSTNTEPCPVGKYRNPDTNRCKNISGEDVHTAVCTVGQERNPETNRCRKLATAAQATTTCPTGQERNAETNRCRKIAPATTQKPCDPGQERNPETGRCRKLTSTSGGKVLGEAKTKSLATYHYLIILFILVPVVGYAVYEYRYDLAYRFKRLVGLAAKNDEAN